NLVLASKADRERAAQQVRELGGEVTDLCEGSVMIQAKLTPAQLLLLLAHDTVVWADPTTPVGHDMDNARIQGGGNYVETLGGFRGTGVRAEITESFEETHVDFTNIPSRVRVRGTNSTDNHGHCTAGIVGGNGTGNAAARGMMPDCWLIEGAYSAANHYAQTVASTNPSLQWRSMLATASWGSAQTTAYTSMSQAIDDALFDSDLTRFQSQSNTGNRNSRPEAWAKNIISVGGVAHHDNSNPADDNWTSASYGPASDNRIKPEICAYYEDVLTSDRTGANGYNTAVGAAGNYYTSFGGTSAATPICAGHGGLLQEMFTDGLFGNPLPLPGTPANRFENKPHMTTSKALLCGTARPYPQSQVLRRAQGWGFPDLARAYDARNRMIVVDEYEALQQGQSRMYFVFVPPGATEFRAVMAYADPAAVPSASIHRVNDVNLKVVRAADGTIWWGNNGLWAGDESTSGGNPNDRDTLETVLLNNPQEGIYLVAVEALSVVQDGKVETPALDVDFALVVFPIGGGYRSNAGPMLDLVSTGPGHLGVNVTNLPAVPWTDGYTFFSVNTAHPFGFGGWFGAEFDFLVAAIWQLPPTTGDVFHFTNAPGFYPNVGFTFPPSLVSALAGIQVDAVVMLLGPGQIVAVSNVDRILLQ
ncbi:MAG: hypothetical protein FJ265_03625, partial [Planctomycetes bacterium]|nr:hypothetical protein [Planctomycetota bacterium]